MWHDLKPGTDVVPEIFYSANFYTTTAVGIIKEHAATQSAANPLFLYLPCAAALTLARVLLPDPSRLPSHSSSVDPQSLTTRSALCHGADQNVHSPNQDPAPWETHDYPSWSPGRGSGKTMQICATLSPPSQLLLTDR